MYYQLVCNTNNKDKSKSIHIEKIGWEKESQRVQLLIYLDLNSTLNFSQNT